MHPFRIRRTIICNINSSFFTAQNYQIAPFHPGCGYRSHNAPVVFFGRGAEQNVIPIDGRKMDGWVRMPCFNYKYFATETIFDEPALVVDRKFAVVDNGVTKQHSRKMPEDDDVAHEGRCEGAYFGGGGDGRGGDGGCELLSDVNCAGKSMASDFQKGVDMLMRSSSRSVGDEYIFPCKVTTGGCKVEIYGTSVVGKDCPPRVSDLGSQRSGGVVIESKLNLPISESNRSGSKSLMPPRIKKWLEKQRKMGWIFVENIGWDNADENFNANDDKMRYEVKRLKGSHCYRTFCCQSSKEYLGTCAVVEVLTQNENMGDLPSTFELRE